MEGKEVRSSGGIQQNFSKLPFGTIIVTGALSSLLTLGGMGLNNRVRPAPIYIEPPQPTQPAAPTSTPGPIKIFVNGEVGAPQVYELPADAIVQDAINIAGGFTDEAFAEVVNLAQPLTDGMQIYVPAKSEGASVPLLSTPEANSGGVTSGSGELVDLNAATKAQLESLPGVGPSTAQKILDFREDNGPFSTIEDVMNVSGIGPAKFEDMAPFITIGSQ